MRKCLRQACFHRCILRIVGYVVPLVRILDMGIQLLTAIKVSNVGQYLTYPESEGTFVEGCECDLYDLPSEIPENWVCMATGELEFRRVPGRFKNAKQGDIILSPGGDGMVAKLLRQVDPPQIYSHSGIMSKNQTFHIVYA